MRTFYEFFAGGGMARAGLGHSWTCTFANDFSAMKSACYRSNWGGDHFHEGDVGSIRVTDLPGLPSLVWASTPCQDLSLAGNAIGLGTPEGASTRSGAFWPWWSLMKQLAADGRKPRVVVLENVVGALSSNNGADFSILARAFADAGYTFGALVIDARHFLPQSRPRLFIVGVDSAVSLPDSLCMLGPQAPWHTAAVQVAFDRLPENIRDSWAWWGLPMPLVRRPDLPTLIDDQPTDVLWHAPEVTDQLISAMTHANTAKLRQVQAIGRRTVGTIYKRTRSDAHNQRICRTEVRFDGIAGCLRTPSGGSSRQTIIIVEGDSVRTRLLSSREAARLMGLPDTYKLPNSYNDGYHVCGDGVAVPVVRFLARHLLEPLVSAVAPRAMKMAG